MGGWYLLQFFWPQEQFSYHSSMMQSTNLTTMPTRDTHPNATYFYDAGYYSMYDSIHHSHFVPFNTRCVIPCRIPFLNTPPPTPPLIIELFCMIQDTMQATNIYTILTLQTEALKE